MNFLISKNPVLIEQYWNALLEQGESLLLSDFSDLVWRAKTSGQGLALLDIALDKLTGMQRIADLRRLNPNLKVLIIAIEISTEDELSALAAGASGSCSSGLLPDKIRQILNTVQDGGIWISSTSLPLLLQRLKRLETLSRKDSGRNRLGQDQDRMACLTPREREIVDLIANGDSNKAIANKLDIAERTVKVHLSVIFQKLKVSDRLQLALLANKNSDRKKETQTKDWATKLQA